MNFKHNVDDTIEINGVKIDYETFLRVEPNYIKPNNVARRSYTPGDHNIIYTNDGNQIGEKFPWEDGDRYISRLADFKEMQKSVNEENKKIQKDILVSQQERASLIDNNENPQYPTIQDLTVALWEMIVEGKDDSEINKIQEQRNLVREWKGKSNGKNR